MRCLAGAGVTIEFVRSPKIRQTLAGLTEAVECKYLRHGAQRKLFERVVL